MAQRVVLAVDEGTTNSKAVLVAKDGSIVAAGSAPVTSHHPQSGWVEQDAAQIWASTTSAISSCIQQAGAIQIVALGISNQRESVLLWDRKTGKPLGPVVTWQCRRTAAICERIKAAGHETEVIARTGLPIDPLFPATKIAWLLESHGTDIPPDNICIGTVDAWLIWNFSGGLSHAIDRSNAARTQLFNLDDLQWDPRLCALFDVPADMLPTVKDSASLFGTTKDVDGLPDGIPIGAAIGDSHGALFGHGAYQPGDGKITFGTGSSVMATVPEFIAPPKGVTTTIAWSLDGTPTYAFEGNISVSASILPWTAELLGLSGVDALLERAQSVENSLGVQLVPAHVGLGSPHWNSAARGLISGLSFGSGPAHVARAAAESIALQVHDVFEIIEPKFKSGIGKLYVDGGPSSNPFLMSMVADYLNHPVITRDATEASALGAAYLAGLTVGFWPSLESLADLKGKSSSIEPSMERETRNSRLLAWKQALDRSTLGT